jgi:hypothetical protein
LQVNVGQMSLQSVCKLLMVAVAAAALLPGLVYSRVNPGALSTVLLAQVWGVSICLESLESSKAG